MTENNTKVESPAGAPPTDAPQKSTLKNFCQDLSVSDKRVELIAAFYYTEKVAGRTLDTSDAYAERFAVFSTATPQ